MLGEVESCPPDVLPNRYGFRMTSTSALSRSDLIRSVEAVLERYRLTMAEFVEFGVKDELEDDTLRDLWLMAGAELIDE